jgi:hypothetical protein
MGVALRGNLEDFGIAEVFQLIGQQRKTGVLKLVLGERTLRIAFDEGAIVWGWWGGQREHGALSEMLVRCGLATRERVATVALESQQSARPFHVVAAESGDVSAADMNAIVELLTPEVVFEVLRWDRGSLDFSAQDVDHDRAPDQLLAAEHILMNGMRMVDEWATFARGVENDDVVFAPAGSFELYRQRAADPQGAHVAEMIFGLVDGRLSARRVIDLSRVGTFEGTRTLAALRAADAIRVVESSRPVRAGRTVRHGLDSALGGLRLALTAVAPLAVLGAAAWLSMNAIALQPLIPGVAIDARAFERAQATFEARRLRNALEVHRYLWQRWPDSLEGVAETGWELGSALAAPGAPPYYYRQRGDEVLLLAPDR